ncbi:hypothetical protein RQP53_15795 [Paucibacter sp. APW11]|uniref:Uncharacterized protein n=1 Tax=Roseateles aquae TaxID=3077235 RepID=A0ABU3PDR8_9BURK|nr:hypothetical protein [Paucibacter sp. APW11]MDT9000739.1 hypothetical protein [Paucibacter sp. APW11]
MPTPNSPSPLYRWLGAHPLACFVLTTLSFVLFGGLSLDLARLVTANSSLLLAHGWQAMIDGGLQQLLELWGKAFVAIAAYLVFKLGEQRLVQRMSRRGAIGD